MLKKLVFLFVSYFLISMLVDQWFERRDWNTGLSIGMGGTPYYLRYDPKIKSF